MIRKVFSNDCAGSARISVTRVRVLLLLSVEDMKDHTNKERVAGFLPMGTAFQCAFRINQNIGDILNVADFRGAFAHFQKWVVASASRIGRVEQKAVRESRPPTGRQVPILALDVVNHGRRCPGQQGRQHQTNALARARRSKAHHMLWTIMAEIVVVEAAEEDALCPEQAGVNDLLWRRPPRRAVGRDQLILPRAPDGIDNRKQRSRNSSARGYSAGALEHLGRVSLISKPPLKQPPR